MANLTESPIYEPGIFQLEKTTPPLGGAPAFNGINPSAGHANVQGLQLANRTNYLNVNKADKSDLANSTDPLKGASLIGYDGETVASTLSYNKTLTNYTALRAYTGTATVVRLLALGIAGTFYYDGEDTTSLDDGGTLIVGSDSRRWKRFYEGEVKTTWFGAVGDGVADDRPSVLAAYNKVQSIGGGQLSSVPRSKVTGTIGENKVTPTLVRSNRPTVKGIYDGTATSPVNSDQPALWVQKYVSYDSGTDRYRLSPGAIFGEVNALGSDSSSNQNDASWMGIMGNARMLNKNKGTAGSPISDGYGSLTAVGSFVKADFFPGNGTAQTALWGYPSTITATDTEFDALVATGQGWAVIGLEVNIQIDHKDVGYRENIAGASTTIGSWLHNYRSSTTTSKNWNFGQVIDGGLTDDAVSQNLSTNWSSQYVGMKIDHSKNYGILFGRRMMPGSTLIKGPDSHLLSDGRPLAFADTGDNPIIWGQYTGSTFNDGMMWQNAGTLFYRKAGTSYDVMLNGEKALFENATGVGINTKTPGFNLDITSTGATFSAITSYGNGSSFVMRAAGGTSTTPTGLTNDANIGFIAGRGYNSSVFTSVSPVGIGFYASEAWTTTANGTYITFGTTPLGGTNRTEKLRITASGDLIFGTDNLQNVGSASRRAAVYFAGTGTINTSDRDAKQDIRDPSEAELAVAQKCKKLIKAYKFKDAVEVKGNHARIHFGVIAQDIVDAFASEGLDAHNYGMICFDEWEAEDAVYDNGEMVREAITAGSRYGVRYEELLSFIIAAM